MDDEPLMLEPRNLIRSGHALAEFRWAVDGKTPSKPARLQQAHQYVVQDASGRTLSGSIEWVDVPTVVVDETESQ